jgi:uncharacterized protein YdhG (YjbR/CyaY superfamily)
MTAIKPNNIDEYIAGFPQDTQKLLEQIRETIKKAVPDAEETISYAIPTFKLKDSYLVYFAGYKNHIGLYPVPAGNILFEKDFASYKTSGKGTIQFALNKPLPLNLITKIVKFRVKENLEKAVKKGKEKTTNR